MVGIKKCMRPAVRSISRERRRMMAEKKQSDLRRLLSYMRPYKGLLALAFLFLVGATVTEMMGPF